MRLEAAIWAVVVDGRWRPGIGDPTVMGWVTAVAYLVAALGCGWAAGREPLPDGTRRAGLSRFWLALACLMVGLGINKQLDLQSLLTQIGRDVLKANDLYGQRRPLQVGFIVAVALACASTVAVFLWAARDTQHRRWPAVVGMVFILGFVVIRASSFHHVDLFLAARLGRLKWNWILELGGIGAVGAAAFRVALSKPPRLARSGNALRYRYRINPP
jgi:hypothetical protein